LEVRTIMTSEVGVCSINDVVRYAAEMMRECDCGAIPVVDSRDNMRLVGIITDRDIAIRAVANGLDSSSTKVGECMSNEISFVLPDSTIHEVEQIMENRQVRRVPVVDENRRVCGMVSLADIARTRPDQNAAVVVQKVSEPAATAEHAAFLS